MSAVQILTVVGSCVQIQLGRTHVAAVQVIHLILMDAPAMVRLKLLFPSNFIVTIYYYYYSDIDECSGGSHECTQTCTNSIGSYTCSCNSGYRLASNRRACIGKWRL